MENLEIISNHRVGDMVEVCARGERRKERGDVVSRGLRETELTLYFLSLFR